jgi:hypothetical protein
VVSSATGPQQRYSASLPTDARSTAAPSTSYPCLDAADIGQSLDASLWTGVETEQHVDAVVSDTPLGAAFSQAPPHAREEARIQRMIPPARHDPLPPSDGLAWLPPRVTPQPQRCAPARAAAGRQHQERADAVCAL